VRGEFTDAVAAYSQALDLAWEAPREQRASLHNNRGNAHDDKGDYDRGIADFTKAIELEPDEPVYHNDLAYVLAYAERWDEALAECQAAVKLAPDDPDFHDTLGAISLLAGQLPEAEGALRKALSLEDPPASSHATLAYCLLKQGKPDEARAELAKVAEALAEERLDEDLLYFAAKVYSQLGDTEQARALAGRFVQRSPQHPWAAEMRELIQ